jgi:thiamine-phosphate pyrophosphorylase
MMTRNWRPRCGETDYIALGPIFPTTLKSTLRAAGHSKITEWKKRIGDIPLVAISGIKLNRRPRFCGRRRLHPVVSDVTNADPDARVRQWLGDITAA